MAEITAQRGRIRDGSMCDRRPNDPGMRVFGDHLTGTLGAAIASTLTLSAIPDMPETF